MYPLRRLFFEPFLLVDLGIMSSFPFMLHLLPRNYLSVLWLQLTVCNQVCQLSSSNPNLWSEFYSSTPNCVTNIYISLIKKVSNFSRSKLSFPSFTSLFSFSLPISLLQKTSTSSQPVARARNLGIISWLPSQLRTTSNYWTSNPVNILKVDGFLWFVVRGRAIEIQRIKRILFNLPTTWRNMEIDFSPQSIDKTSVWMILDFSLWDPRQRTQINSNGFGT